MAHFLDDYDPVQKRLGAPKIITSFWEDYPDGRVATKIEQATDTRYIISAELFKQSTDDKPFSSGLASESVSDRGVNSTSALENAETSAIGRALANAGYAAKGKRPSREEMTKVVDKPLYSPPGSRAAAVEGALRASFAADSKEPAIWSVGAVETVIPAGPPAIQTCKHGQMKLLQGLSKTTKKPYYGYVCEALKDDQCEAKWAKIMDNGSYYFPSDNEPGKGGE